jgi:myo-inositol-1(or 4)-monophosphatase
VFASLTPLGTPHAKRASPQRRYPEAIMNRAANVHEVAVKLAQEAGDLIVRRRAGHIEVANTKSSDVDVVTAVDKESEEFLYRRLQELRPGDGFLGEEGQVEKSTTGVTWVVDPIDGTVNFLYNIPHYAVSIAAVTGEPTPGSWQVEAGAVLNPATGELFHAARGQGAFLGERRLQIGSPPPMNLALLGTGFAYSKAMRREQVRILGQLIGELRDIRRMGTASLDLAFVAAGRIDVYFERTLNPWDHAAGELLVTEAGGIIAGIRDLPQGREGIFAGHPTLVTQLKARISEVGGDTLLQDVPGWGLE